MLERRDTKIIKGLAIIFVIVGHVFLMLGNTSCISKIASLGVSLFLFVSGYGLVKSYEKKGFNRFFINKINKIYIPYLINIIVIIFISIYFLKEVYSIKEILFALLGIDFLSKFEPSLWYITYIFIWYLIFYMCFKFEKVCKFMKVLIMFLIYAIVVYLYIYVRKHYILWNYSLYGLFFPLGVFYALYMDKIIDYLFKFKYLIILWLLDGIVFIKLFDKLSSTKNLIITNIVVCSLVISIICYLGKINYDMKILKFIGGKSYYIYLVQGFFLFKINLLKINNNNIVSIVYYVSVVIFSSMLLKKVYCYAVKNIKNKKLINFTNAKRKRI